MAIKVNGTTVIDDSRNFTNIASGFKTVNGTSVVGSGDISAGASTTYAAVGTYVIASLDLSANTTISGGTTYSGSSLIYSGEDFGGGEKNIWPVEEDSGNSGENASLSGTWRCMVKIQTAGVGYFGYGSRLVAGLWVRIS